MSGKFLKARQLAKEMEEKAKKTAEEKKKVTESLVIAESLLEESEKSGGDVGDARELIEEARQLVDDREIDESLEKVEKALEILRKSNTKHIKDLIAGTEELHELIDDEERYKGSQELLEKTKELIEDDKFKDALDSAKESLELSQLEVQEKLTAEISTVESLMTITEGKGKDISEVDDILSKAKESIDEGDYGSAFSHLDDCKDKLSSEIEEYLDERINKIEKQKEVVGNTGINTTNIEESISKAKVRTKDGDFEGAMDLLKDAQKQLDKSLEDVVENKVEELDSGLEKAKEIDASIDVVNALRNQILDLQRDEQFSEAYNVIEDAFEKLEEAKFHRVLRTIAESRDSFIKAKEIGIDISEPMNLLGKARDELKEGKHKAALEWANSGKNKVNELVKEHDETEARIEKSLNLVDEMRDLGIELPEAPEMISKAEDHLRDNDYDSAMSDIDEFEEYAGKIVYDKIMELIEDYEIAIATADEIGLPVDEYTEKLEDVIALTKSRQYGEAGRTSVTNTNELKELIHEEINSKVDNFKSIIDRIKSDLGDDEDISELEKLEAQIDDISDTIEEGKCREANRVLQVISEKLKDWHVGEAEESFNKAKEIVYLMDDMEIENTKIEDFKSQITEAEEALSKDDFSTVIQLSNSLIKEINKDLRKTAESQFADAKMEVVKAKKAGVIIEDLRKKLIQCKKQIRDEDYAKAIKLSMDIINNAVQLREKRKSSYESISELSGYLTKLKRKGAIKDAGSAKKILLEAKESFQNRDYTQAEKLAEQAKLTIDDLQKEETFEKEVKKLKGKIEISEKIGVDTSEAESMLQLCSSDARRGDYEGAINNLRETTKELNETLKKQVKPKIDKTKDIISSAKEIDIDVSGPEKILTQAEELWKKDEFIKALDKVEECQKNIDDIRNKSRKAAGEVKRVKERMEEAKDIHANIQESEKILLNALDFLKKDKYDQAISEARKAEKKIIRSEKNRVKELLANFKEKIEETRKQGINTALADNLIRRAYKEMENSNYRESINLAMQSEGELERIELQQDISKRSISSTNKKLETAKSEDIQADDAEKLLNQAKQAYKSGFYVKAFDNAIKSVDKLNITTRAYKEANKLLDNIENVRETASSIGLDVSEVEDNIEEGKIAFEQGRYEKALSNVKSAETILLRFEEKLPILIEEIESNLNSLKERGTDTGHGIELLKQAKIMLGIGDIIASMKFLSEAKDEFGGEIFDEYNKYADEASSLVEKAKKFGANVTAVESLLTEAKKLEDEDITLAKDKAKEALDKIEEELKPYSPSLDLWVEGRLAPLKSSKVSLGIKNTGAGVAKSPSVEFEGCEPVDVELPNMLKAGEEIVKEVEITPTDDIVVIKATGTRIFDEKEIEASIGVKPSTGEFEIKKSYGDQKCLLCKGNIQKGLDIIVCECGETYHKTCGERNKVCKECGTLFEKKKEKKASKRVALKI